MISSFPAQSQRRSRFRLLQRPAAVLAALITAALLATASFTAPARAGDEPFIGASNFGLTGIFETPTARVLPENRYRFGVTAANPYNYYWGTIGLFDRLEVNGLVTEVRGVPGFTDIGNRYGNFKDRSFDFKLQIVKEGKYLPAIAIAVTDPHGTRLYGSQSIVASKQIYPFDFTIGMGNGRLGKEPLTESGEGFRMEMFSHPKSWWRNAQLFGGIQLKATDWLILAAEYSPVHYERHTRDPAQPKHFTKPVSSNINFGLRLKPFRQGEIDISWQRGEQLTVGGALQFDIGRPILPIHDPPYREPEKLRQHPLADRITEALLSVGFSDIGVEGDDFFLRIDAQNNRYFFTPGAAKALLDAVAPILPPKYEYIRVRFKENGIPVSEFITTAAALEELKEERISRERFFEVSSFRTEFIGNPIPRTQGRRWYKLEVAPALNMYLNDPSRFFSYRFGAAANLDIYPWKGGSVVAGVEAYPANNIDSTVQPLSIPVRSDIALYKKEKLAPARLMFEQIIKADMPAYARAAAGYLEIEYAGLDAEIAVPMFRGRLIAGAGGSLVRKRSPDNPFEFSGNQWYKTAFISGRLNIPEANLWFDIKGGRFLAGDWGARFSLSKFICGVTLTAWYSVTDTSVFSDPHNRGYHDKGVSVTIPIRLFIGHDSRTAYRFGISPWTRDAGQDIEHYRTLPDYIGRNTDILLDKDTRDLYKKHR
ncbi:MAG: YjbH domain-containing protein [Syntrophorhabdaceae bacterium]|nr:YjbH domain-containing protein [Syntrophorhabdaceae bacterium]